MQLVTPSVVPTAVSTAIITCKIVFQTSFFIFFFLSFLVVQHLERDRAGVHPCRFPLRFLVVNLPFLMNDSAKIQHFSLKNNSCPESRASLSRISCIPSSLIMYLLDATRPERAEAPSPGQRPGF